MRNQSEMPACGFEKASGGECRAFALPSGRCWNHDPERADERHRARARGGTIKALKNRQPRFDTPKALIGFTGLILGGVLAGRIAPDVGRVVLYGVSIQRQLIEASDLEQRLLALEAQLPPTGAQRRVGRQW